MKSFTKPFSKAFTLIELIVGITISMMLMVGVGIFISSGMQNIFQGQKVLENTDNLTIFNNKLNSSLDVLQSGFFSPIQTSSGIIFKRGINYSNGGFSYIGTQVLDQVYCKSDAENPNTNNIFLKSFIPFEEQDEDLFSNYESIIESKPINIGSNFYKSFQKEHLVKIKNGSNWDNIVGKGIFGDKFSEGASGTDIYINTPTGLTTDGTNLYISDTLNNRILYLDGGNKIHILLDETDGLNEPTGLFYENNSLYIANSGNGEILKYSSYENTSNPTLSLSGVTINNINKIEVDFFNKDGSSKNITGPTNKNDVIFSSITKNSDYIGTENNKLRYYFVNYVGSESSQPSCLGTEERLVFGKPVKCTSTGTGKTSNYIPKNLNNEIINIDNILPNFSGTGSYYVNLKVFNGTTLKYSKFFPYFTQSDNDLTTKDDNTISILYQGLNYPTGIWGTSTSDFNEFLDGTYSNLKYDSTDDLLDVPIKSLNISYTPNDLISIILKYYKSYNCYNLDDKVEKTFFINKSLK